MFLEAKNALIFKKGNETLMIEPWGENSLRVRSTLDPNFIDRDWALTEKINHGNAKVSVTENGASIVNGKIDFSQKRGFISPFFYILIRIFKLSFDLLASNASIASSIE